MNSTYDKIDRVRKPRVHIKYEIETEGHLSRRNCPLLLAYSVIFPGMPATGQSRSMNGNSFKSTVIILMM